MTLALLFLTGAALLGTALTRRMLRGLLGGAECVMWGTVVGWVLTTLCVYAVASWEGRLAHAQMVWATVLSWLAAALALLPDVVRLRREGARGKVWRREYAGLGLVLVLFAPVYWRLFSTHMLPRGPEGVYSGGSSWYDMSFHAALASSFLHGENFPAVYTPLPPGSLHYPFMPDFQTAMLMGAGADLHAALMLTGLPLALIVTGLFYSLAWRVARSQRAAALATILFLLNGGLGFIDFFRDWRAGGKGFFEFWNTLPFNYANAWERGLHWTNLIADTLLPQRTSLFGLPLALMVFTLFAVVWQRQSAGDEGGKQRASDNSVGAGLVPARPTGEPHGQGQALPLQNHSSDRRLLLVAGVLTGLLPLFHPHTYVAIALVSILLFLLRPRRAWLAFWTPALLLAAPRLLWVAGHAVEGNFLRLQPGWMGQGEQSWPLYMLRNFGVPLLLAGLAWLEAPRAWKTFYLAFVGLFAFSLVLMVTPNAFDNIKLMHYWHAMTCVLVGSWLVKLATARRRRLPAFAFRLLAFALAFASVTTGLTALQSESLARARLFTAEELAAADFVRARTAPRSLFLTAPAINQPVLCLAGRAVLRGPTSWLWSHGYEFREREADVRRIYAGAPDALELLAHYRVQYVYLGDAERRELSADADFFDRNFPSVYRGQGVAVYDTRAARSPGTTDADAEQHPLQTPPPRELASRLERDPYQLLAEFPRTSFFVYRLFKASHARPPRRQEFMQHMQELGRNLFVGAPGWERQLESNAQALVNNWTARAEFRAAYDGKPDGDYVGALHANAGLSLSRDEHDRLVRRLSSGEETRASVLRRVADDGDFREREYDTAYVLTHFFAYLGRNPDDPPDTGSGGLEFWRDTLARTRDYRSLSRAFMESGEYKARQLR